MPASATTQALTLASRFLSEFSVQIKRTLKSRHGDPVHDIRVLIRKLQQAAIAFQPCFPKAETREFHRQLKKLMSKTGPVRDCDITLNLLRKLPRKDTLKLACCIRELRAKAERDLAKALKRWLDDRALTKWRAKLIAPAKAP